jgi:tRNA nucleotidyltransferase (CCA-adding enzyme)
MLNQQLPFADKQNSGFDFEKKTRQAMEKTASLVSELSAERCHAELIKVFSGNNPFGYIALLREVQLLEILFPALAHTIGNRQPVRYHPFDTYNHTLLTLRHLQHLSSDPLVKFAMLYHDVGKPEQYAFMDKAISLNPDNPDRTGYIAHPEISVRLALEDFAKLAFSEKEKKQICWYIKRHHRPGEILDSKIETRTKKLRELLSE